MDESSIHRTEYYSLENVQVSKSPVSFDERYHAQISKEVAVVFVISSKQTSTQHGGRIF